MRWPQLTLLAVNPMKQDVHSLAPRLEYGWQSVQLATGHRRIGCIVYGRSRLDSRGKLEHQLFNFD